LQPCEEKFGIQWEFKGFAIFIFGSSQTSIYFKEKEKLATYKVTSSSYFLFKPRLKDW
tara:strand:- start:1061 stop:1234 length:174 start_codon:yes stop_codon:yes gene_type:complete